MKPRYDDNFCQMYVGDATTVLSELPEKSIHCCVTSPPYFGLRSYLAPDHPDKASEGGTQETPEAYVAWLVDVFRGVWRVLRDDGTCWLNLGDSYNAHPNQRKITDKAGSKQMSNGASTGSPSRHIPGLKPKDLLMIPARVALALQQDGWFLRSQIVWAKSNPMPESVTDRPTQATEMVYLLTKKPRYFYDAEAVKEAVSPDALAHWRKYGQRPSVAPKGNPDRMDNGGADTQASVGYNGSGRNLRNYWQIATRPYPGSHYATFPPELPLRCIKAGTSEHGVCSECGAPWRRVVEREYIGGKEDPYSANYKIPEKSHGYAVNTAQGFSGTKANRAEKIAHTLGVEPTCSHDADTIPATVLDPFSGSGTTGLVARKLGRRSVLIDLDDRNVKLLEQRMGYQGVLL